MADRDININAKIANLQAIKDQLSKVQVNLNVKNSTEIDQLLKAAQKGLTIDIRFKVGPELKQLLDLQRKGLNLRYNMGGTGGGGASPKGSGNFFSSGQTFYGGSGGSFMNQDQFKAQNQARAKSAEYQKNLQASLNSIDRGNAELAAQQRQFDRQREQIERQRQAEVRRQGKALQRVRASQAKANTYVEENPLSAFLGQDVTGQAAEKFGVRRSSINSKPNFFNLNRLRNPDTFKDILFTTLLGGKIQGLGAAAGAATFGREGTLIGANVAQATVDVFKSIAESLTKATKAGAEYERAVTGITGIFQATTDVVDADGNPVGIRRALAFQGKRAEGIQRASQRALLPLGITGATASALTQSLAAGLAQRGITPDEKSTETLLRRFGAAIQTLQPELASDPNLIRRGFEDIIGGGPQASRTELGSALRGIAPGLFTGGKKSIEDILRATEALDALVEAIRNSDKATIEYQKALGTLQLAQQELGKGILEGLAPGLKAFNEELQKGSASNSFKDLGKAIGEVATAIAKALIPALTNLNGSVAILAKIATGDFQGLGELAGRYLTNNRLGGTPGDEQLGALNQKLREQGKPTLRRTLDGRLIQENDPNITGDEGLAALNAKRFAQGKPILERVGDQLRPASAKDQKLYAQENINTILNKARTNFGIENPRAFAEDQIKDSPAAKILGIEALRDQLRSRAKGRNIADIDLEKIGLNAQQIQAIGARQQEREGLFDSSEQGQLARAKSDKEAIAKQLEIAEANLRIRQRILKRESSTDLEGPDGIKILNARKLDEEAIAKARAGAVKAEEEVLKLRQQGVDKEKEIAQKRLNILQKGIDVQDTGTFAGRRASLNARDKLTAQERQDLDKQILDAQGILNNPKASEPEKQQALARIEEAKLNKIGNISKAAQNARDREQLGLSEVSFALGGPLRRGSAADAATKNTLDQKVLGLEAKGLPLELERLAQATRDATKALDSFASDKNLRRLGAEGEVIAADEAIVAAGGTPFGDPTLVKGSPYFDPRKRAEFEREVAEERARVANRKRDRFEEEDAEQTKRLENEKAQAKLNEEKARTTRPEEIKLQQRALERQAVQNAIDAAKAALDAKQQDPTNPTLIKEYEEARKKVDDLIKEQIAGTTSSNPALAIPQGPATTLPGYRGPSGPGTSPGSGRGGYGYPGSEPKFDSNGRAIGLGQAGRPFFNINGMPASAHSELEKAIQDTMNMGFAQVFGANKAISGGTTPETLLQKIDNIRAILTGIQNNLRGGSSNSLSISNSSTVAALQSIQQTLDACACGDSSFDCCGDLIALLIEIQQIIIEFSASFREIFASEKTTEESTTAGELETTPTPDYTEELVSGKLFSPDKKDAINELLGAPNTEVFGPRNEIEDTGNGLRFTGERGLLPGLQKSGGEYAGVVVPGQDYVTPVIDETLKSMGFDTSITPGYVVGGTSGQYDSSLIPLSATIGGKQKSSAAEMARIKAGLAPENSNSVIQGQLDAYYGAGDLANISSKEGQAVKDAAKGLQKWADDKKMDGPGNTEKGQSIFDKLGAQLPKPLTQDETTTAFLNALNSAFV